MPNCSFCNRPISKGTGFTYVDKTGKIFHFDKKKCEKNMFKLKRKARNLKWTKEKK